ncbi:uncharacterized protein [Oryza sativa Japonica Group]|uniref:Os01g0386500 protein n=2 Tax=Oryza sativa subsp. japonica TaxID=39947 RepID=B7EZF0_ORYSJ|nr:Os01g0386500 [Oryza sativa Japonica Group]BAG97747.1 unnamed protein product [Oryza sativa Japonica Group]|eukprot:NP_001043101.1 Os01g0386500 [Oryza sativa Japonica Group]
MAGVVYHQPISSSVASLPIPFYHRLCLTPVIPFFLFPLSFSHFHKPPTAPPKPAGAELLLPLFQPSSFPPMLSTDLPGCAASGNTLGRRRRGRSTTEAPAPCPFSSLLLLGRRNRRKERNGRKKRHMTSRPRCTVTFLFYLILIQFQSLDTHIFPTTNPIPMRL